MSLSEILTIFALFGGPMSAVYITRHSDNSREKKRQKWVLDREDHKRKWAVFRDLMRYRKEFLSPDFVGALNLIEVDFYNDEKVKKAWSNLFEHYKELQPEIEKEKQKHSRQAEHLRALLLQTIGKSLGVHIDGLAMFDGGYSPQGWLSRQENIAVRENWLDEVFLGERHISIKIENLHKPDGDNSPTS